MSDLNDCGTSTIYKVHTKDRDARGLMIPEEKYITISQDKGKQVVTLEKRNVRTLFNFIIKHFPELF